MVAERFRLKEQLKHGQGIETWRAVDGRNEKPVVLKRVSTESMADSQLARLRHEATLLVSLDSGHSPSLVDSGSDDGFYYLASEWLDGESLDTSLKSGPLSIERTLQIGIGLSEALEAAHQIGIIHRDLKPSNVIVSEGRAFLVDFGLGTSQFLPENLREVPVGTVRYMAPEQSGLLPGRVGPAADLYSLGALLYECLTGEPPFVGTSVREVLRSHASTMPKKIGRKDLPPSLETVLFRLLAKSPATRFASAADVRACLVEIRNALEQGRKVDVNCLAVSGQDRIALPSFIGRKQEMKRLEQALDRARLGEGGTVLVSAPSGYGKSRFLEEFSLSVNRVGGEIYRGQGLSTSAETPFQIFRGVAAGLNRLVDDPRLNEVRSWLRALSRVLPELLQLTGEEPTPAPLRESLRYLLENLGSSEEPVVVFLDDCQWADEASLGLLDFQEESLGNTLVVLAFRDDEVPEESRLNKLQVQDWVKLPPLEEPEIAALLKSQAGKVPDELVQLIQERAEGSPFLAESLLRGLVEEGGLKREADHWELASGGLEKLRSSHRGGALLALRVSALDQQAQDVLSCAALLGKIFSLDALSCICDKAPEEVLASLNAAKLRGLVWENPDGLTYTFVHDRIRESLLSKQKPAEAREMHSAVADFLSQKDQASPFELAYHLQQAGREREASPHALAGARQAMGMSSVILAERYYRMAWEGQTDEERLELAEEFADVLGLVARYGESRELLSRVLRTSTALTDRVRLTRKQAQSFIMEARMDKAVEKCFECFEAVQWPLPRGPQVKLETALAEGKRLLRRWKPGLAPGFQAESDELIEELIQVCLVFLWAVGQSHERPQSRLVSLRALELIADCQNEKTIATYLGVAACTASMTGTKFPLDHRTRRELYDEALQIITPQSDPIGWSMLMGQYMQDVFHRGKYRDSLKLSERSAELFFKWEIHWYWSSALVWVALSHYLLGDLSRTLAEVSKIKRHSSSGKMDYEGAVMLESMATFGKVEATDTSLPIGKDIVSQFRLIAELVRRIRLGQFLSAADLGMRHVTTPREPTCQTTNWITTAFRLLAQEKPLGPTRTRALRQAREWSEKALKLSKRFVQLRPHALREAAYVASLSGHDRRAQRLIRESLKFARNKGMRLEEALSMVATGIILESPEQEYRGHELLRELGADVPWLNRQEAPSLADMDRFESLLQSTRIISTKLDRDSIYEATIEAWVSALRTPVALVEKGQNVATDGQLPPVSQSLIQKTIESGQVQLFDAGSPEDASDSAILSEAASVICVPICVDGQVRACLYAAQPFVLGYFGEEEERLAKFICTLTGAALKNADTFLEREKARQLLADSETRFRGLVESAPVGIAILATDSSVVQFNPAIRKTLGSLEQGRFADRIRQPDRQAFLKLMKALCEGKQSVGQLELKYEGKGGQVVWGQTSVTAVPGSGEGAVIVAVSDVSSKRLEQLAKFQETERRLLSAELHDVVSQPLAGLMYRLQACEVAVESGGETGVEELQDSIELTQSMIADLRLIMTSLRGPETTNLVSGITSMIETYECPVALDLHPEVEEVQGLPAIFTSRIVQESLTNVRRHAKATMVEISLTVEDGRINGRVSDDGCGFDPEVAATGRRLGLRGMRERVDLLAGSLELTSAPGKGTTVMFGIPLSSEIS